MRQLIWFSFLLLFACARTASVEDATHLNGYWQISKVTFPDNTSKTYTLSSTVDYFEIEGDKGFRKKVQPSLNGSFDTSDDAIPFQVIARDENVYLVYSNGNDSWEELLLAASPDAFTVRNEEGIAYTYTRYEPITLEDE